MTLYYHSSHTRLMLLLNSVSHKSLSTIKSRHDEINNQPLLGRLKNLSVIGGKKSVPTPPAEDVSRDEIVKLPERRLPLDKLKKMLTLYQTDPLTWNPSVLGRIFKIPEDYCSKLAIHVLPMAYWHNATTHLEVQTLIKTTFVVDVARLKSDDNYLVTYKKIVFPDYKHQSLPKKALPEYLDQLESQEFQRLGRRKASSEMRDQSVEHDGLSLSPQSIHRSIREEIS